MQQIIQRAAIAVSVLGLAINGHAQTTTGSTTAASTTTPTTLTTQTATMDKLASSKGQVLVADKTAVSFIALAGSKENALSLVNGLRNGMSFTLTAPAATGAATGSTPGGTTGTTAGTTTGATTTTATGTTITPPTGKMGWGNVFISLSLAQKVLTQAGITDPTAAQLQTALMGGDLTGADGKTSTVKGVLQLRADGMGWGKIAQVYGTKLGPVVSGLKAANRQIATAPSTTTTASQAVIGSKVSPQAGKGVVTAGGTTTGTAGTKGMTAAGSSTPAGKGAGIVTAGGAGNGHGNAFGKGIVTAAGATSAGVANTGTTARSGNPGAGLVTATGAATNAASGITTAQGNAGHGNANGNGNGKGKGG